jgi:nucleotide-binding universal stress UspA family protein
MEAEYTLLRVVKPALAADVAWEPLPKYAAPLVHQLEALQEKLEEDAEAYLEKIAQRLRAERLCVQTKVVSHGQPALAILEEARCGAFDLIALETHARGGLARFFLGSVADKILRGTTVPVLVHHPTGQLSHEVPADGDGHVADSYHPAPH